MGITDFFSDILASVGFQEARAEAPAEEEDNKEEGGDESGGEKSEEAVAEEGGEDAGGEKEEEEGGADAEEEEEEEEEDDEPVDPKQSLEAECAKSAQCAPYKHHYQECVERITAMNEDPDYKGPKEDCVEEFFHLQHCATQCAAPRLFRALK